jgi:hypothetical protein
MAPTPPGILEQMHEARVTCQELIGLLRDENGNLHKQRLEVLEARLDLKKRLTLRLEKLVQEIKAGKAVWSGNPQARTVAQELAHEMAAFQEVAQRNLTELKAAHKIRADIIAIIKDTFEAAQTPLSYSKDGALSRGGGTAMLRREI